MAATHEARQTSEMAQSTEPGESDSASASHPPSTESPGKSEGDYDPPQALIDVARSLPKIELHAHLNGSIRASTLLELAEARAASSSSPCKLDPTEARILRGDTRTLSEMFSAFSVIHRCVRGAATVRRIAREMLQDAEADGVVYLEVRSTPRAHAERGMDEEGYVLAVLAGFEDYAAERGRGRGRGGGSDSQSRARLPPAARFCHARLILSIDRKDADGEAVAQRTVDLALKYRSRGVVGIDLSGDPAKGSWETWLPALRRARDAGLRITLHAGEAPGTDEEMSKMLDFKPDRLGHLIHLSASNHARLRAERTPIELCLTSNILSSPGTIPGYDAHHFPQHYYAAAAAAATEAEDGRAPAPALGPNPVIVCTDDTALFSSPLSREVAIVMGLWGLSERDVRRMMLRGFRAGAFLSRDDDKRVWEEVLAILEEGTE